MKYSRHRVLDLETQYVVINDAIKQTSYRRTNRLSRNYDDLGVTFLGTWGICNFRNVKEDKKNLTRCRLCVRSVVVVSNLQQSRSNAQHRKHD